MRLELKHLAPYLPYDLEIMVYKDWALRPNYVGYPEHKKGTILKFSHYTILLMEENNPLPFKPLLRPLSDLTKEIEHNGEKFVPIEKINKIHSLAYYEGKGFYDDALDSMTDGQLYESSYFLETDYLPYKIVQLLFKWHFDVFGLIDKGLAIDINKIGG